MLSVGHCAQRLHDLRQCTLFEQVASCPGVHGGVEKILFAMNGEKNDLDRQRSLSDLLGHREAAQSGHVHVKDGNVRLELFDLGKGHLAVTGLSHDFEPGIAFDHLQQSPAQDRMVICNQDTYLIVHVRHHPAEF